MRKFLVMTFVFLIAGVSFADNVGCGLGSYLITEKDTVVKQSAAAIINMTSSNQTFGITSGTLGCDRPAVFAQSEEVNKFVHANMDTLAVDIAKGEGETLSNLAVLMGVEDVNEFGKKLQSNFDYIYASADVEYAQVINAIYAII